MNLENGHIYHIFNQGNDRQFIFFKTRNYLFFLKKIQIHITPFADILAWCLMPNHFHLMVYVSDSFTQSVHVSDSFTQSEAITKPETGNESDSFTRSEAITSNKTKTLNDEIGIMLRSFTRAINKQENRSGYLFKAHTKAECLTRIDSVTPSFYNTEFGARINIPNPENEYPQICFNYIHNNPVKAGLVNHPADWEFSSYRDYCGLRNGKLINKKRAKDFGLQIS